MMAEIVADGRRLRKIGGRYRDIGPAAKAGRGRQGQGANLLMSRAGPQPEEVPRPTPPEYHIHANFKDGSTKSWRGAGFDVRDGFLIVMGPVKDGSVEWRDAYPFEGIESVKSVKIRESQDQDAQRDQGAGQPDAGKPPVQAPAKPNP